MASVFPPELRLASGATADAPDAGGRVAPWHSGAVTRFGLAMLDVDGTLRGERDFLPGARDLLGRLGSSGTPIALASGRAVDSLELTAADFPQIGFLAPGSGSMALRRDGEGWRRFAQRYLPPTAVTWTANRCEELGMEVWAYTDASWILPEITPRAREEVLLTGSEPHVQPIQRRHDVIKMLIFATRPEHHALVERIKTIPGLDVVCSYPGYLDIVHSDSAATKGGDFLIEELGIGWADVLAIGDGENDLGMLSKAGVACCMGSLTPADLAPAAPGQRRADCANLAEAMAFLDSL